MALGAVGGTSWAPMFPRDHWYAILDAREVRRGKVLGVQRLGVTMAVWRDQAGDVHATADRCPHRGASLSLGRVRDGCLECPFHGFRFDGTGRCVATPCTGDTPPRPGHLDTTAYVVREAHGFVWLWWGAVRAEYPAIPWFPELDAAYVYAGLVASEWPTHWTRSIENQLDWPHLPFVHRTTIGIGAKPAMVVEAKLEGDRLDTWLAGSENPDGSRFTISLLFPNLWLNPFGGRRQIGMIAFVPLDDHHTRMYIRTYVHRFAIPGLAHLTSRMTNLANRVILGQDARVVCSQPQVSTAEVRDERLVQADLPLALFRRELRRRSEAEPPASEAG